MKIADLQKVWRVVAGIAAGQIIGGLLGLLFGSPEAVPLGTGAASLPGFILGALWHVRTLGWREMPLLGFLGVLALLCTGFVVGVFLPRSLRERDSIAELARLQAADVRRIEIQVLRGSGNALTVTDGDAIAAFVRASADVEKYSPNHPQYLSSWYVVLLGPIRREYELHLRTGDPSRVFGSFVEKHGDTSYYHGSFQSQGLRSWVSRYLEGK